jgi:hypothetical protein
MGEEATMTYREPPEGWSTFGTHIYRSVPIEFSDEEDEAGMPLWERPRPPVQLVVAAGPCGLCGKDPAAGYASTWTRAGGETWYCHGDDDESPTCYERSGRGESAVLSTWTIFAGTADYPGRFVVRQFDVVQGQAEPVPHEECTLHFTIQSARNAVPESAGICFQRSPGDDPTIVETWM